MAQSQSTPCICGFPCHRCPECCYWWKSLDFDDHRCEEAVMCERCTRLAEIRAQFEVMAQPIIERPATIAIDIAILAPRSVPA